MCYQTQTRCLIPEEMIPNKLYQLLQAHISQKLTELPPIMQVAFEMSDDVDIESEKNFFGSGPTPGDEKAFFQQLADGGRF